MSRPDDKNLSRRRLLQAGALSGVAALTGGAAGDAAATPWRGGQPSAGETGDLVLINGRIHTMDERNTVAQSVALENGRVTYVGRDARHHSPHDAVIDLRGRTVVPGIVEGLDHIVSMANRPGYHTPIESATSISQVQQILAARRPGVPQGQFITAMGGFHPNQFADVRRLPNRAELDAAVSDRPVMLYLRFTGPVVVNSLGRPSSRPSRRRWPGRLRSPTTAPSPPACRRRPRCTTCACARASRTRSAARSTRWRFRPASALPRISTRCCSRRPARCSRRRCCRTSTSTACTTRGWRCTARAARSCGCR
jgi:hypothetical protein